MHGCVPQHRRRPAVRAVHLVPEAAQRQPVGGPAQPPGELVRGDLGARERDRREPDHRHGLLGLRPRGVELRRPVHHPQHRPRAVSALAAVLLHHPGGVLTMRTRRFAIAAGLLTLGVWAGGCNFDITNTNQPTLDDLLSNPTRTKLAAAATGVIAGARGGIQALIWRLGSTGREGINLSGNNQPDFVEPYFGPVAAGGSFGGTLWFDRYQHIRSINVYLAALGNAKDAAVDPVQGLSTQEKAGARAVANSLKALA